MENPGITFYRWITFTFLCWAMILSLAACVPSQWCGPAAQVKATLQTEFGERPRQKNHYLNSVDGSNIYTFHENEAGTSATIIETTPDGRSCARATG